MILGKPDMHRQKNEAGRLPYTKYQIDQRAKNRKLLDKNIGEKSYDIRFSNDFLDIPPKATKDQ